MTTASGGTVPTEESSSSDDNNWDDSIGEVDYFWVDRIDENRTI